MSTHDDDVRALLIAQHRYAGDCPDAPNPDAFDASCPACIAGRRLRERVQELERDAARYQWLRNEAVWFGYDDRKTASPWACVGTRHEDSAPCEGPELDAAIDRARGGAGTGAEGGTHV